MAKDKNEPKDQAKYSHYEQTIIRKVQHFYLSSVIEEPIHYIDMIHRIQSAGPDDIIYIHLNTPGGQLDTGIQIINAMQSTQAHVIASVESEAQSLGTLIFLAADEFVVHDNCTMMFHSYGGAVVGKGHEQKARMNSDMKVYDTLIRKLYVPFLSDVELERITNGEDIYIHSDEIRKRLDKLVKSKPVAMTIKKTARKKARPRKDKPVVDVKT